MCDLDTAKVKDTGKVKATEGEKKSFSHLPDHLKHLVEDASGNLTDSQRQRLSDLVSEFQDVFMTPGGNLNQTNLAEHFIDTGDARPFKMPCRRIPMFKKQIVEAEIKKC